MTAGLASYIDNAPPDVRWWRKILARCVVDGGHVLWQGGKSGKGYPYARLGQRIVSLHRCAAAIRYGPIPEGMDAHHTCEYRHCIAGAHLQLAYPVEHRPVPRSRRAHRAWG